MFRGLVVLLAVFATPALARDAVAQDMAVDVVNRSEPTLCAEKDNVDLALASPEVRNFRIEAVHPPYIGTIVVDRWAPDFTNCDMSNDPKFTFTPRKVTFWETLDWWLVGYTFPSFWRPNQVPFRVGDRVETGFHLVQLWTWRQERAEEVLVIYPADGYWRARPLPPRNLRWTAYGSSFVIGPVEVQGRPVVDIDAIAFDPASLTFKLDFRRGGSATLKVAELSEEKISLDVGFDRAIVAPHPFMTMRSMFVTETNSDVAHVVWREKGAQAWQSSPVMDFRRARAVEMRAGRILPSQHNTSAPDMIFSRFSGAR